MLASSRSLSSEMMNVPPVVMSSSQSVASKNVSNPVPVQVFEGHENDVECVRFCPDEDKLVTGSDDDTLRIWNRTTGAVEVLRGHSDWVRDVDVSRDGKMIVSGSNDKTVRIWNRESGETMHVCEGHEKEVVPVQFSPDSSRVVSGSWDLTVRVWSVETGKLAFEPIKCHGNVWCVRHSPSGDRIASGADSVQIWNADTGSGILSIRNSSVLSVAWTTDGTHIIGGCLGEVTTWNSHTGEQLRTWKAHDNWITLSLSPSGNHLATCAWDDNTAFVFDVSTGEQIAVLKHNEIVDGIAYSPSGKYIATGCQDSKVYLWEAPVVEDPSAKSSAPPLPSLLDRPAVPLAGPSRNNRRELDAFWDTLPNRDHQASPQREPQRVFNKVRDTFANVFTRGPAGAAQTTPRGAVRETVEPVEVAAGRDKVFWIVIERIVWTPVKTAIFMMFFCRKPGPQDGGGFAPINRPTTANPSRTQAGNATTNNQSARPKTVHGAGNAGTGPNLSPTRSHDSCMRTQPKPTVDMNLSGTDKPGAEPSSSATGAASNSQVHNQPERIEMVAIPETSTVSAHASSQPTHSTYPLSFAFTPCDPSSSTAPVSPAPLSVSSPEERALIEEYRRLKDKSVAIRVVAEPVSDPAQDRDSYVHHERSPSPSQHPGPVTPSVSSTHSPISSQTRFHIDAGPSSVLDVSSALLSPTPSSAASRHPLSLHRPSTTGNLQSLDLTGSVGNTVVEARDSIKTVSTACPVVDEADRERDIIHLQEQVERRRQQLDDAVAAVRKAEAERDGPATGSAGAGPSSTQGGPSGGSRLITELQVDPSAFSNIPSQQHPSSPAQYISDSIEAEEQANEKGNENALSDPTNKATDSPHSVYLPHHHGPPKNDLTMASSTSTAADVANFQRSLLQMQEQLDQLRRRIDDPKH